MRSWRYAVPLRTTQQLDSFAMNARRSDPSTRSIFIERGQGALDITFVLSVALSPLALGGTHPTASFALCAWFSLITILAFGFQGLQRKAWRFQPLIFALLVLIVFSSLRVLPIFAHFAPEITKSAWSTWPELGGSGTLAPGRFPLWAARTLTLVAVLSYSALRFARSDRAGKAFIGVAAAGGVTALVGIFQHLTQQESILGFYKPLDWSRAVPLAGPFVNPNQAGALIGLGALACAVLVGFAKKPPVRAMLALAAFGLSAMVFALEANGAALAVVATGLTLPIAFYSQRLEREKAALLNMGWLLALFLISAVTLWKIIPLTAYASANASMQKTLIWSNALSVPNAAPLLGFGPGGFAEAYATLGQNLNHVWVSDPESGPLQFLSEHGYPLGLLFLSLFALSVRRALRKRATAVPTATIATPLVIAYFGLETITGMGLHASAYIVAVACLLGSILGRSTRTGEKTRFTPCSLAHPALLVIVAIGVSVSARAGIEASLNDSRPPLPEAFRTANPSPSSWQNRILSLAKNSPASPPLLLQAAWVESTLGNHERALELATALRRHAPNYPNFAGEATAVALRANAIDTACAWLRQDADGFGAVSPVAVQSLVSAGVDVIECLETSSQRRIAWRAVDRIGKRDIANALAFQVANSEDAGEEDLVLGIRASIADKFPEIASLWVDQLLEMRIRHEDSFLTLIQWVHLAKAPYARTEAIFERAIQSFPESANFQLGLAETLIAAASDEQASARWYERSAEAIEKAMKSGHGNPEVAFRARRAKANAAWTSEDWGEAKSALIRLERYAEEAPNKRSMLSKAEHAELHFRMAKIAIRETDYFTAQRRLRRVLELEPNNQEAAETLARIGG